MGSDVARQTGLMIGAVLRSLTVVAVMGAAFGGILWITERYDVELARQSRAVELGLVDAQIASAFDQAGRFALALAETTARRATIRDAMDKGDRAQLKGQTEDIFAFLRQQTGVRLLGYHDRELRYFLRMHKPEEFGDDVSVSRPMIVAANRQRRPQVGIEVGGTGLGLRAVTVIESNGRLAGTIEIGLDLKPLIETVKSASNSEIAVVVSPTLVGNGLDRDLRSVGDLVIAASTDDAFFAELLDRMRLRPTASTETAESGLRGHRYNIITRPLVDFSGRLIGFTLAVRENSDAGLRRSLTEAAVVALCGAIAAFVVFAVLFRIGDRR